MLSRRNVRIKVMQVLYALGRDEAMSSAEARSQYLKAVETSYELYLFNLFYLLKIAGFARQDAERRAAKHLPNAEDKIFQPKLYTNPLTTCLADNDHFQQQVNQYQLRTLPDDDIVRKLYIEFSKTPEYKQYLKEEDTRTSHLNILLRLCKFCVSNELYEELIEDEYPSWPDDKSLIVGTLKKTLKQLPTEEDYTEAYRPGFETVNEFGEILLNEAIQRDEELLGYIEPVLKNWDADRVAIVDMLLLKMALAELIIFKTIPTKVTINEFVELAKLYSTDKSRDFINGILDRLMKQLKERGVIKKEGRGLVE